MDAFTPIPALVGGGLIGLAAAGLLLFSGQIAGISGIIGGIVRPPPSDRAWRVAFDLGLVGGGFLVLFAYPSALPFGFERDVAALIAGGVLVGVGTRMAHGCTSGHGVCGLARLSLRSLSATITFILAGAIVVYFSLHGGG